MACTNLLLCDGSVTSPSASFNNDTNLGFYRIGNDQMGLSIGTNGKGAEFGNFTITNTVPAPYGPNTVRYTQGLYIQPLGVDVESTGLYIKMNHNTSQMVYGIYGEIDAAQNHVGGSFSRVVHNGAGDAHYVAHFGANGLGYESASWADGTTGFLADVQKDGLPNSVLFNALWQQPTVPNYGLFVATDSPGHSLTISKLAGSNEGQVQIRITEPAYSYNRFEVFNSGQINQKAVRANSTVTMSSAPEHRLVASYWNGTAPVEQHAVIGHAMDTTSPTSHMYLKIGPYGSEQYIALLSPGKVDLQGGQLLGIGGLSMKAGGGNVDMQGGTVVNCNSVQTQSAMTVVANGFTVAQFSYDSVNSTGQVNLNVATTNVASTGSATLPSNPLGFMVMMLNGSFVKVPYYNV